MSTQKELMVAQAIKQRESVFFWSTYILNVGYRHLVPSHLDMGFIEFYNLDVAAALLGSVLVFSFGLVILLRLWKFLKAEWGSFTQKRRVTEHNQEELDPFESNKLKEE